MLVSPSVPIVPVVTRLTITSVHIRLPLSTPHWPAMTEVKRHLLQRAAVQAPGRCNMSADCQNNEFHAAGRCNSRGPLGHEHAKAVMALLERPHRSLTNSGGGAAV